MAMGRASGERRVEKAIMNALDSPLIYGSDITHAKRILFNIYSSDEAPVMVPELDEIDDFFDRLNPDIKVIWGISTDNTIGMDAKVTILATGMEETAVVDDELKDDAYYESLIPKLYRPLKKEPETPAPDPVFTVEAAPEPEPSVIKESETQLPFIERAKRWFAGIAQATME